MNKNGFTLIELAITVAALIIMLSISVPLLNFYKEQILKSELVNLEMNINYLKKLSDLKNRKIFLDFNLSDNSYSFEGQNYKLNSNIIFGYLKNSKGPPSNPDKIIHSSSTFKNNQIVFEPKSKISSGVIYICDCNKKYMYALTTGVAKKQIVRKYKYLNEKWHSI